MILKRIALIASFILAGLQFAGATKPLDSLFESWRKKPGAEATEVRYTGTFDGKIRGFMFQRGMGNGWTYGLRIACQNVEQNDLNKLFATFDNSSEEVGHVVKQIIAELVLTITICWAMHAITMPTITPPIY